VYKNKLSFKYIIIGAGLSGLTTAYSLLKNGENDFLILEGRNRLGGRINTDTNIDLGATWFQSHHTNLNSLLDTLKINKFEQYSKGQSVLVYNTMAPAHYFESQHNGPSAYRITGGSISIIQELSKLLKDKIKISTNVLELIEHTNTIDLKTDNGIFSAEKVISTIPPKLASTLKFTPSLPENVVTIMKQTHTWMSNAMKVGLTFTTPFWREKKFDYLEKYLGEEIKDYISYSEKDWSKDTFTSCPNLKSVYMSPQYGNPIFNKFHYNGKLLFSGTETSPEYGGYLDGAVYSGLHAAEKILIPLEK